MNLSEALIAALNERYAPGIVGYRNHRGQMDALAEQFGSKKAAAEAAGIPRSTWGHWEHRTHPRDPWKSPRGRAHLGDLRDAYERLIRRPTIRARIDELGLPRVIGIDAVVVADPSGSKHRNRAPHRRFNAGGVGIGVRRGGPLPRDRMSAMVAAWLAGADPAPSLISAIDEAYPSATVEGHSFGFEGDVRVTLDPPDVTPQ